MDTQKNQKDRTIKVAISLEHNERLNSLLARIKQQEAHSLVTKQKLVELAIERINEADALSFGKNCINRKALALKLIKEQDQNLSNPEALLSLLKNESTAKEK